MQCSFTAVVSLLVIVEILRASDAAVAFIVAKGPRGTHAAARAKKPEEVEKEAQVWVSLSNSTSTNTSNSTTSFSTSTTTHSSALLSGRMRGPRHWAPALQVTRVEPPVVAAPRHPG